MRRKRMSLGSSGTTEYDSGISEEQIQEDDEEIQSELFDNKVGLSQDMRFLAGMPELCDVMFIVGEEKVVFFGVKAILAIRSRVFYKMLFGPKSAMAGKVQRLFGQSLGPTTVTKRIQKMFHDSSAHLRNPNITRSVSNCQHLEQEKTIVYIEEFEPEVFKELLEYIHTGSVLLLPKTILGLMNAADHFALEDLRKACIEFSQNCIKVDTVCSLLVTAERYIQYKSTKIFIQRVLEFVDKHGEEILLLSEFVHLPRHVVELVLSREDLSAAELTKYRAAERWARHHLLYNPRDSLPEVMRPFVHHVCFQDIPTSILIQEIHPLGIVPDSVLMTALAYQADPCSLDRKVNRSALLALCSDQELTPRARGRARLFQLCSAASPPGSPPPSSLQRSRSVDRNVSKCSTTSSGYESSHGPQPPTPLPKPRLSRVNRGLVPSVSKDYLPCMTTVVRVEPVDPTEDPNKSKSFSDLSTIRVEYKL